MTNEEFLRHMADEISRIVVAGNIDASHGAIATTNAATSISAQDVIAGLARAVQEMDRYAQAVRKSIPALHSLAGALRILPQAVIPAHARSFFGVPMIVSSNAVRLVPVRAHRRRRNQSLAYHLRVQKKWAKRWGTRTVPAAFMLGPSSGLFGNNATLIVHDEIDEQLRREL